MFEWINVIYRIYNDVQELRKQMATTQEELTALQSAFGDVTTALNDMKTRVTTDLGNLQSQITGLQSQLSGQLDPNTQAQFDTLIQGMNTLKTDIQNVDVPPTPPTPVS